MHRSLFAKEISNSMVLGMLGVFVTFVLHFTFTYLWLHNFGISVSTSHVTGSGDEIEYHREEEFFEDHFFTGPQILCIAAIFSSIDLLAVMPQVSEEDHPRICALISGQGIFCDAVSVVLVLASKGVFEDYEEKERLHEPHSFINGIETMFLRLPLSVLFTGAVSIAIGIFIGIIGSLILK